MPQTSNSASQAYVTSFEFFNYVAYQLAADMLRTSVNGPRPSFLACVDPANPVGQRLQVHLNKGAGEIEAFCAMAHRYNPEDLQALTGVSLGLLQWLNSFRALWSMYQILKPGTGRPEDCPGAKESFEYLQALRDGKAIFTLLETQDAGLPVAQPPNPNRLITPNAVARARRLFVGYGPNSWPYPDNGGGGSDG